MPGRGGCAQLETQLLRSIKKCARHNPPPTHPPILDRIHEPLTCIWTWSLDPIFGLSPPPPLPKKGKLRKDKLLLNMMQIYLLFILVFYPLSHTGKFLHAAKVIYWVTWVGQRGMIQNESPFNCACVRKKENSKKKKYPQSWPNILLIIRITQPGCKQMYQTALCT